MSDRPTPETDAVWAYKSRNIWADKSKNILEHARRLERERDEAREDCVKLAERLTALELSTTSELARLERERDEVRELCRELLDLVAYGLGQNGSFWSQAAMRQAREKIQKAKALEAK